ncbi:MAG: helix-turn-helix transcriptional regulator [Patulibacter minatonensis]
MVLQGTPGSSTRKAPKRLIPNRALTIARLNKGWSPPDFARICGVSASTIRAAEAGFYIEMRSQREIAKALGVPLMELFPEDRQKEFRR